MTCSYYYGESGEYKTQIEILLSSLNNRIHEIIRNVNIFPWFKQEAQICGLIIVSFLEIDALV